jgi:hypothetical protein
MFRKPFVIAAIALSTGATLLPSDASAGDPGVGALVGGVLGAVIGHSVNSHNGAVVGGVLGALTGASIAAHSGPYYGPAYGAPPPPAYYTAAPVYVTRAPAYYAPSPVLVRPATAYYVPPAVIYRPRPVYVQSVVPHPPRYERVTLHGRNDWRAHRDPRGHDGYDRRGR